MADMVTLRNLTKQELPVPGTAGELVFGAAGSERAEIALTPEMADTVIAVYGKKRFEVVDVGSIAATFVPKEKPKTVWVANVTGNPDAPATVKAGKMKNRQTGLIEEVTVENVNRQPRTIHMEMIGEQGKYTDKHGNDQGYTKFPKIIEIPPYQRRELEAHVGSWIVRRDNMAPPHERGAVIKSRDHVDFEPSVDWSIDELHEYLGYVDPVCQKTGLCGPSEAALVKKHKGLKLEMEKRRVKLEALKRLHFRLSDPKYRLPTQKEFADYMASRKTGAWTGPEVDEQDALGAFDELMEQQGA